MDRYLIVTDFIYSDFELMIIMNICKFYCTKWWGGAKPKSTPLYVRSFNVTK